MTIQRTIGAIMKRSGRHPEHSKGSRHVPFAPQLSSPSKSNRPLALLAMLISVAASGCKVTPPPKPLNQLTTNEQAGHIVFQQNCSRCHDDREGTAIQGPTMLGVYKNQYLPSGAPANDDRIRNVILHGRGMMPALGNTITDSQIDDLLAYLKTL